MGLYRHDSFAATENTTENTAEERTSARRTGKIGRKPVEMLYRPTGKYLPSVVMTNSTAERASRSEMVAAAAVASAAGAAAAAVAETRNATVEETALPASVDASEDAMSAAERTLPTASMETTPPAATMTNATVDEMEANHEAAPEMNAVTAKLAAALTAAAKKLRQTPPRKDE